jgi:prepilin-type N-terminal cleavage/methylation domain-containing protein
MNQATCNGFTLIELLVVISIIAILASIAYPVYTGVQERAKAAQDLNNLRQIGLATQMYLNDNDGGFFLPTDNWMQTLNPKYVTTWKVFQSPFDNKRAASENSSTAPVSYGFNANATSSGNSLLSEKVTNPSVFILFAPNKTGSPTMPFSGTAGTAGVTVSKNNLATHSSNTRIDACMADLHVENMLWTTFRNDTTSTADPRAPQRWTP